MPTVRIYKPVKNPMQSGKARQHWVVEYEQSDTRFIEPLMGWTANSDTKPQLRLNFESKEEAVPYAKQKGLTYQVIEPHVSKTKLQSYADNFC